MNRSFWRISLLIHASSRILGDCAYPEPLFPNTRAVDTLATGDEYWRADGYFDIAQVRDTRLVGTVLVARLAGDQVVIELDRHNRLLVDALLARGVPKSHIILAHRGDAIPA